MKRKTYTILLLICVVLGTLMGSVQAEAASNSLPRRVTASDVALVHGRHGHTQYHSGAGTTFHTWEVYQYEAALINVYLRRVALAKYIQALRSNLIWRWSGVAECESGGNWYINTGNGYYGGVQFLLRTWHSVGGSGYPHQNSPSEQAYRAEILKNSAGLGQWPRCGQYYRS